MEETTLVSVRLHRDTKCDTGLHYVQAFIDCGALGPCWYSCDSTLVRVSRFGLINCVILARKALTIKCLTRLKGSFREKQQKR